MHVDVYFEIVHWMYIELLRCRSWCEISSIWT